MKVLKRIIRKKAVKKRKKWRRIRRQETSLVCYRSKIEGRNFFICLSFIVFSEFKANFLFGEMLDLENKLQS